MWFAITTKPLSRRKKESAKEFYARELEIIFSAETKELLEEKLKETRENFPQHIDKYLKAGIKFVEADSIFQAKKKAKDTFFYFDNSGQYKFL